MAADCQPMQCLSIGMLLLTEAVNCMASRLKATVYMVNLLSPQVLLNNILVLVFSTEREWLQLAVLPANVTDYHLNASDGMIYVDFRISAFNQYGCSEIIVFEG